MYCDLGGIIGAGTNSGGEVVFPAFAQRTQQTDRGQLSGFTTSRYKESLGNASGRFR